MKTIYLASALLVITLYALAGIRQPDSLNIIDNKIPAEILVINPPLFFIDSLKLEVKIVRQAPFKTSYNTFNKQLNATRNNLIYWIQFSIQNKTDSAIQPYFNFGTFDYMDVYFFSDDYPSQFISDGQLAGINQKLPYAAKAASSFPIKLAPHQAGLILIKINQRTPDFIFDKIKIFNRQLLYKSLTETYLKNRKYIFFSTLFMGLIICQMIYALLQWIIIKHKEYLYYFFYLLALVLYFFSRMESFLGVDLLFSYYPILGLYLNKALIIIPYLFYFEFLRAFLDLRQEYPKLNKWVVRTEYLLIGYLALDIILIISGVSFRLQSVIFTMVVSLVFLASILFICYLFTQNKKIIYFIITGSLCVGVGNIIGMIFTFLSNYENVHFHNSNFLIYSQVGIVIELFCFTTGLSYKTKLNEEEKIKSQNNLIEQLKANDVLKSRMQGIRNKISLDLHDDIGSTLSSISILSEMALMPKKGHQTIEMLKEIKQNSISLMERMDEIVWSINPKNDSLENLLMRVQEFAAHLFEAKEINYNILIEENTDKIPLIMEYRQHIYLILKEAINNLVKYSNCTEAEIIVNTHHAQLNIMIKDNGIGFNTALQTQGNGLLSMRERAKQINADLTITSKQNGGTRINLVLKIR